jgi:hypothetical protein
MVLLSIISVIILLVGIGLIGFSEDQQEKGIILAFVGDSLFAISVALPYL